MLKARIMPRSLLLLTMCLFLGAIACRPRPAVRETRYDLKGKVIAVNKTERTATIDHEAIPGYMAAMTMEFEIKRDSDLETLKPGNVITGTLVVTDDESWLEILASTDGPPPGAVVPGDPKPGEEVPDFRLTNQDGKRIRLRDYRGQAVALTFIYTRCPDPDQCTLMSTNFAAINRALQKQSEIYKKTHLLSISFDPNYDTPSVLRSYGAGHTGQYASETFKHWEFATGTEDEVKAIAQYFGMQYFTDAESGKDKVIHSLRTAVIRPDGRLLKVYRGNEWKPDEVIRDVTELVQTLDKKEVDSSPGTLNGHQSCYALQCARCQNVNRSKANTLARKLSPVYAAPRWKLAGEPEPSPKEVFQQAHKYRIANRSNIGNPSVLWWASC